MFKTSFQIPDGGSAIEYRSSQWRTPNPLVLQAEGTTVADVYEKMASDGFDKFIKGLGQYLGTAP